MVCTMKEIQAAIEAEKATAALSVQSEYESIQHLEPRIITLDKYGYGCKPHQKGTKWVGTKEQMDIVTALVNDKDNDVEVAVLTGFVQGSRRKDGLVTNPVAASWTIVLAKKETKS